MFELAGFLNQRSCPCRRPQGMNVGVGGQDVVDADTVLSVDKTAAALHAKGQVFRFAFPFFDAGIVKLMAQSAWFPVEKRGFPFPHRTMVYPWPWGRREKPNTTGSTPAISKSPASKCRRSPRYMSPPHSAYMGRPVVGKGLQLVSESCIGLQFPGIGFRKAAADVKGVYRRKMPVR